jgi:hypothetical protein
MAGELAEDANRDGPSPELWGVIEQLIWQGDFQGKFQDKEWVREMYFDRIETINNAVPSERLIMWSSVWTAGSRSARRSESRCPTSRSRACTTRTSSARSSGWSRCRRSGRPTGSTSPARSRRGQRSKARASTASSTPPGPREASLARRSAPVGLRRSSSFSIAATIFRAHCSGSMPSSLEVSFMCGS